jgi:hypothetical protein
MSESEINFFAQQLADIPSVEASSLQYLPRNKEDRELLKATDGLPGWITRPMFLTYELCKRYQTWEEIFSDPEYIRLSCIVKEKATSVSNGEEYEADELKSAKQNLYVWFKNLSDNIVPMFVWGDWEICDKPHIYPLCGSCAQNEYILAWRDKRNIQMDNIPMLTHAYSNEFSPIEFKFLSGKIYGCNHKSRANWYRMKNLPQPEDVSVHKYFISTAVINVWANQMAAKGFFKYYRQMKHNLDGTEKLAAVFPMFMVRHCNLTRDYLKDQKPKNLVGCAGTIIDHVNSKYGGPSAMALRLKCLCTGLQDTSPTRVDGNFLPNNVPKLTTKFNFEPLSSMFAAFTSASFTDYLILLREKQIEINSERQRNRGELKNKFSEEQQVSQEEPVKKKSKGLFDSYGCPIENSDTE